MGFRPCPRGPPAGAVTKLLTSRVKDASGLVLWLRQEGRVQLTGRRDGRGQEVSRVVEGRSTGKVRRDHSHRLLEAGVPGAPEAVVALALCGRVQTSTAAEPVYRVMPNFAI